MYASEQGVRNAQYNTALEAENTEQLRQQAAKKAIKVEENRLRPSVNFKPKLIRDGNKWCALYGEDLQEGVAGFGDSPDEAMRNFDSEWYKCLE